MTEPFPSPPPTVASILANLAQQMEGLLEVETGAILVRTPRRFLVHWLYLIEQATRLLETEGNPSLG